MSLIRGFESWFLRNLLLPVGDTVFGQRMMSRLKYLEEGQWWSKDQLDAARDRELRKLVQTIYQDVPFYRQHMESRGIHPGDIRSVVDIVHLPVTDKAELRTQPPVAVTRRTGQRTYKACSSGSTGQPFCIQEDAYTAGWYRAAFLLSLEWGGWKIGNPHLQTGMTLSRSPGRWLKDKLLHTSYVSAFDLSDRHLTAMLEQIEKYSIRYLMGYPGSMWLLAQHAQSLGWNQPLNAVFTWGDTLSGKQRSIIETAFSTRVLDQYGCGEGIQVSAQCGSGEGYHVHSLDVIVEYLDDNDQPVDRNTPGHLVLTRLHAGPTPLVRYRVGDIGVSGDQTPCDCGRCFERMQSIMGRETDVILTPDGNRMIVHFFTGVLEYFPEIQAFQVEQTVREAITLRIVPAATYTSTVEAVMIDRLRAAGAHDLKIEIDLVSEIPFTAAGKRRFVVSQLAQ